MKKSILLLSIAVLGFAGCSFGGLVLDQQSPYREANFNADSDWFVWQQGVTVGLSGPLLQIDLYVETPGSTDIFINLGTPWQSDAHDFTTTLTAASPGWISIDTSSAGLAFNVGDHFVIGVDNTEGGLWLGGDHVEQPGGPYDRGELWLNENIHGDGYWDMAFRTYVPEPGTVLLLALGGLAVVRKRG